MDEQACPRCKTTSYRNPNLKLLVNICGHKLCQTCVDVIFTRPSAACPQCNTALRRNDFRAQQFEDAGVEREVDIRKKIVKIFNKRQIDFSSCGDPLRAFNDYLEEVEIIVFNLVNKIDVDSTKKKIEQYKKHNEHLIRKNNSKQNQEESQLQAQLAGEQEEVELRHRQLELDQLSEQRRKRTEKESLINDLIYANAPADEVIARHKYVQEQQQSLHEQEKRSLFFADKHKKEKKTVDVVVLEVPLYEYMKPDVDVVGPNFPTDEDITTQGHLEYVRETCAAERAAGYTKRITCQRAIQEAFDCLFL